MSFYHSKKMTLSCNYYLEPCEIIIVIFFLNGTGSTDHCGFWQ